MRLTRIGLVAGLLLTAPIIGHVQQVPGEVASARPATALAELQVLVKTQTEAIQILHAQVKALETRVEKLEKHKPAEDPR